MELWWDLGGRCFGGVLLVKRGDIGAGLELLRTAFARVPENAFIMLLFPFLAEIAEALGRDGKSAEGLSILDEALGRSERFEERWCVAELLRIKGESSCGRVRRRPRRPPRSTFCTRSIGRAGRVPCHGSCEHPQALHGCSISRAVPKRRASC